MCCVISSYCTRLGRWVCFFVSMCVCLVEEVLNQRCGPARRRRPCCCCLCRRAPKQRNTARAGEIIINNIYGYIGSNIYLECVLCCACTVWKKIALKIQHHCSSSFFLSVWTKINILHTNLYCKNKIVYPCCVQMCVSVLREPYIN